ncbi:hypothetical protein LOTGIDRAFT_159514 [Lottia gigantea]|uniref:Uncharacterized protein n=1 Tax=Lottia gigantea TaxID=225164 RepID=V4AK57_LOTGI|nr:hypothetical protein LOTGIDRAFT_159514 [Lottia gigantea]ESO97477.1 hypothetical protein LOTGIDRAFT_159514 [Lottia gigantea]
MVKCSEGSLQVLSFHSKIMAQNGTNDDPKKEEEYDFFAPHPHPKPRVKTSFFEVVPDAYSDKSLSFTGDMRRVKKVPETEKEKTPEKEEVMEEQEPVVEEEVMQSSEYRVVDAQPWDTKDGVILHHLSMPPFYVWL